MISLVVPCAGYYRHNEKLWPAIGAAAVELQGELELLIVTQRPASSRLYAMLSFFNLTPKYVAMKAGTPLGTMVKAGIEHSAGETVVVMHDDAFIEDLANALRKLDCSEPRPAMAVPQIIGAKNLDQDPEYWVSAKTSRYVDSAVFAMSRQLALESAPKMAGFLIDGYQIVPQKILADTRKYWPVIAPVVFQHEGGQTLPDVYRGSYRRLFGQDAEKLGKILGVTIESGSRPAMPRIRVQGSETSEVKWEEAEEQVNLVASQNYRVIGPGRDFTEPSIRRGDKYSLPSLIDVYDVALHQGTGLGDALMHTAALVAFKERYPNVLIRVFAYSVGYEVMKACPAVDVAIDFTQDERIPQTAVFWDVANGMEGTPSIGFRQLGIESVPIEERRMGFKVDPVHKLHRSRPAVGIQVHGGWRHKRWKHTFDLARMIRARGLEVELYRNNKEVEIPEDLAAFDMLGKTKSIGELAGKMSGLAAWVGFDSGGSYLANAVGVPSVWLFASHDPAGLIGQCGSAAPFRTIWLQRPGLCAARHRVSCRRYRKCVTLGPASCPLRQNREDAGGADCLDDISPETVLEKLGELGEVLIHETKPYGQRSANGA